jgi:histidinol dehydrogenase
MSIAPLSQYLQSQAQTAAKKSSQGSQNQPQNGLDSNNPQDIISEIANGGSAGLLKYQEQQIAKKAREDELNSLGLTPAQFAKLPQQEQDAVQAAIDKAVQQANKNALGGGSSSASAGSGSSAQAGASGPNSLISSSTPGALLSLQ